MTTLPRKRLGTTGMQTTRVGFGAWAVGGGDWNFGWGEQDDAESVAAIRAALERGVNWIDTAAVYGLGHSEEVVRKALDGIPQDDRPFVFTKCGLVWEGSGTDSVIRSIADPASIRRECEASLRRLGVERIDLLQLHWPPDDRRPIEDYWPAFLELRTEGKIRAAGLSNHTMGDLERAERLGHVDSLQPPFSAIHREAAAQEIPWCLGHGTGVIAYSPMQAGLLTGAFSEERVRSLEPGDWRRKSDDFQGDALRRNLALADAMRPVAERHGVPVAAVAVAWTLAWPGVTGAIVGARNAAQVVGWLPAAELELDDTDLDEIADAIERSGAGSGTARPPVTAPSGAPPSRR
jgi:aryl-alcohol dehydrogenase-like predicted oxidoreductase